MIEIVWATMVLLLLRGCAGLGYLAFGTYPRNIPRTRGMDATMVAIRMAIVAWCAWALLHA